MAEILSPILLPISFFSACLLTPIQVSSVPPPPFFPLLSGGGHPYGFFLFDQESYRVTPPPVFLGVLLFLFAFTMICVIQFILAILTSKDLSENCSRPIFRHRMFLPQH